MRFAKMTFAVGMSLFAAAAAGLTGAWALVVSTAVMGVAALVAVVVMEERDYSAVEGLYPAASDALRPAITDPASDGSLPHAA